MFSQLERIPSRAMGRYIHVWRFGHHGAPLLVFPSSAGVAHEWQHNGLIDALGGLIEAGRLKVYCTESNVSESWMNEDADPSERVAAHRAFERYVLAELVPRIRVDCRSAHPRMAVAGTSLGAFYSANFSLKFPDLFAYALCLSGRYDATWLTDGHSDRGVYFNNPAAYVPEFEGPHLERVRSLTFLELVCGQGAWEGRNIEATRRFAGALASRGIRHALHLWGHDVTHEWSWWNRQAVHYLSRRLEAGAPDRPWG